PGVLRRDELIGIRTSSVRNRNCLPSPNQFPATLPESLPTPDGMLARISIHSSIPTLHGVDGNAISNLNFSPHQWFSQRRSGAAREFAVTGNIQSKCLDVLWQFRYALQGSKTQHWTPAHFDRFPLNCICPVTLRLSAFTY